MTALDLFGWTAPPAGAGAPGNDFPPPPATPIAETPQIASLAPPCAATGLRDYQVDVLLRLAEAQAAGARRVILVATTGAGKTVIASDLIKRTVQAEQRVLFLAHRRELIQQAANKLYAVGIDSGVIQAGLPMRITEPVQVASVQTLWARAMRGSAIELPKADLVVVDEAHHIRARTYQGIIDEYPQAQIVGLTATPCRGDGRGLGTVFEKIVECPSTEELIKLGFLVPTKVYAPATPALTGVKTQAGDYQENQLAQRVNTDQLVGDIVMHWLKLAERRKTVVFAVDVAHSVHIRDEFRRASVLAEHIDANTPKEDRERILRDLSAGNIEIVTNCQILTEGWDQPDVSCLVLARPTKHMGLYRQMVGRVLRPAPGKDHALVLDHAGCTFQHGFAEEPVAWTLSEDARAASAVHAGRQKNKRTALTTCPECKAVRQGGAACSACGWRPQNRAGAVDVVDGDLAEYGRDKKRHAPGESQADKARWYGQLLWIARERGYKTGWASHKYKERFRVWPSMRPESVEILEPDPVIRSWVRSRQIAWAKSQGRGP